MSQGKRIVVIGLAAFFVAGALACAPEEPEGPGAGSPAAESLVVASFGGAWQEAQRKAMFEPFAEEHGVEVVGVEYDGAYELIREKGEAGEWDVVDVEPVELLRGAAEGIYEEIDYSGIDRDALIDSAVHPHGLGLMTYSIVLGYDTREFSGEEVPRTWADFWDVERFPGKRALRNDPQWMFEIALMADGVPPAELYPIDMDRALASLERIADHVVAFEAWSEPAELLAGGEVALAVGTNGRLLAAKEEAGAPVDVSWHGGLVASDYFVIPRGSRHKQAAQELVAYAVSVEAQARIPEYIDYGPVNRRALDLVPEEVLPHLATYPPNLEQAVIFQADWWLEHKEEAVRRYREWLGSAD